MEDIDLENEKNERIERWQSQINIDVNPKLKPLQTEYTFDEAIEETKIGRFQKMVVVLSGLSLLGMSLENVNLSYALPYAKCDLQLTTAEQGILTSVSFLGIVSTSYFWGFLVDTWGRKRVICTAACCGFFCSFLSDFSMNTITLIVLRFLAGAFLSGIQAGSLSYVSEFHSSKTATRAVAFTSSFMNGMSLLMAPLAMVIMPMDWTWQIYMLNYRPWRLFLLINSLLNLWNGIVFFLLPESPKFLLSINEHEKALQILRRVYAFNTGQSPENYPVYRIRSTAVGKNLSNTHGFCDVVKLLWAQTKPIFLPPLLKHTWKLCYLIFIIFSIGHGTFMWFPEFLVQLQNYNGSATLCSIVEPKSASNNLDFGCNIDNKNILSYVVLLGSGASYMITGMLSSYSIKKVSPKILNSCWLVVSALTCIAINFLTEFNAIVISFIVFLCCCSCATLVMAIAVNLYPTKYRGMATSFIMMFGRLGSFFGSNLVGLLLEHSCPSIFYLNGGLLFSCALLVLILATKNKDDSKIYEVQK